MKLKNLIKEVKTKEKQYKTLKLSIVYSVYEDDKLVYIGLGGRNKRKASGRLNEHSHDGTFSSFRFNYMVNLYMKDNKLSYDEAQQKWDTLEWNAYYVIGSEALKKKEHELITKHNPKYNRTK